MGNIFKIKRRTTGAAGAPATIAHGELAFNEVGDAFYYGKASNASSSIGGKGEFLDKSTAQTLAGNKTFSSTVVLSSAVTVTQVTTAADTYVATTEFVQNVFSVLDGGNFDDAGGGGSSSNFTISYGGVDNSQPKRIFLTFPDQNTYPAGATYVNLEINYMNNGWEVGAQGLTIYDIINNYNYNVSASVWGSYDSGSVAIRAKLFDGSYNEIGTSNILTLDLNNSVITLLSDSNGGGNNTPVTGAYYYSASSNDWYSVSNWWGDSAHTQQATTLPLSSTNVVIVNGSVEPLVSLDNASWVQPASINSGSVGITFTSQNFGNVTCSISGEATFEGNSTYNV